MGACVLQVVDNVEAGGSHITLLFTVDVDQCALNEVNSWNLPPLLSENHRHLKLLCYKYSITLFTNLTVRLLPTCSYHSLVLSDPSRCPVACHSTCPSMCLMSIA